MLRFTLGKLLVLWMLIVVNVEVESTTSSPTTTDAQSTENLTTPSTATATQPATTTAGNTQTTSSTATATQPATTTAGNTQTTPSAAPATQPATTTASNIQTTASAAPATQTTASSQATPTTNSITPPSSTSSSTATATSTVVPTSEPILTTQIKGSAKLKIPWMDTFMEKTSSEYKQMENDFIDGIKTVYAAINVIVDVIVNKFTKGSVVVDFVLTVKGTVTGWDPKSYLVTAIKGGKLGNLTVDPTHVKLEREYPGLKVSDYETIFKSFYENCCQSSHVGFANQTRTCSALYSNATCEGAVLYQEVKCEDVKDQSCCAACLTQTVMALILGLIISKVLM